MAKDFIPNVDSELLAWAVSNSAKITATPLVFGLTAPIAVSYAAAVADFETKLAVVTDPQTKTRGATSAKNDSKRDLKAAAREWARTVNAFPSITNEQRIDLGLNPRTGEVSPINAPSEPPAMEVLGAIGRTLKVRVHAINSERRGKPEHVQACVVMYFVGSQPPADITEWIYSGSSSRTVFDVEFPATVAAGAQVYLCAFWVSPRMQQGPACQPISAYLAGGVTGSMQQAA